MKLELNNPYRNRFIVADLNTMGDNGDSRGVDEQFFNVEKNWDK